jgi:amino acid transporter
MTECRISGTQSQRVGRDNGQTTGSRMAESGVANRAQLKFVDATLYTIVMNTGLRWLPIAAAVGPAAIPLWILALIVFFVPLATAVAELTAHFKDEGGIYVWVRDTYGPLTGFLCGWFYWFAGMPYFAGILYFLTGLLMAAFGMDPHNKVLYLAICVGLSIVVTALQFAGLRFSKWLPNFGTVATWLIFLMLAGLAVAIALRGTSATNFATASWLPHINFDTAILWGTIVFAYSGAEGVGFLRNEIEGGFKSVLRVLAILGPSIAVIYIAGTSAMLVILPASQMTRLGGFSDTLHAVFAHANLVGLVPFALVFLALSQLGGFTAWFGANARLPLAAGIDNFLPAAFAKRDERTGAPVAALLLQGGLMIFFVLLGQAGSSASVAYDFLVSMSILTNSLCYVFMFAAYMKLARSESVPGDWRPPGGARTSFILGLTGQTATLVAIACTLVPGADDAHPLATFLKIAVSTAVMVAAGLLLYWLGNRRRAAAALAVA